MGLFYDSHAEELGFNLAPDKLTKCEFLLRKVKRGIRDELAPG